MAMKADHNSRDKTMTTKNINRELSIKIKIKDLVEVVEVVKDPVVMTIKIEMKKTKRMNLIVF